MRATILICTYGSGEWAKRGADTAAATHQPGCDVLAVHDADATLAEVRNAAAAEAAGDWLCFLDADDELAPGYIEEMGAAWMRGAIFEDWSPLLVPSVLMADDPRAVPAIPDWHRDIYTLNCAVIGTLIRKELFLEVGGFGDEPIYEDWALWLRCIAKGTRMVPVPAAVYRYFPSRGSLRNVQDADVRERTYRDIRAAHSAVPRTVWAQAKARR